MAPPAGEVRFITSGTFALSCISATIGFIFSTVYLTFNVYHRKKRFMKMSSPNLNVLISSGGLILNSTCLLYGIEYFFRHLYSRASVICQMRMWLISLGVTLLFCPMLVKSWRVYQIFRNAGIKRVVITDRRLILVISMFLSVDILILALWQGLDPPMSRPVRVLIQTEDYMNNTFVYIQECVSRRVEVWISVTLFWKAFLLASGLFLAWKTKHVLLPAMRDSSCMIISIISTMFLTSHSMMLSSSLRHLPDAVYMIYVLLLTSCASLVQSAVFFPKVRFYWRSTLEQQMRMSVSTYDLQPHLPAVDHFEEEVVQLVAENDTLKKSLTQKNSVIQILEGHLNNAKRTLNRMTSDREVRSTSRREGKIDSGLDVSSSSYHEEEDNDDTFGDDAFVQQSLLHSREQTNTDTSKQQTFTVTPETIIKRVIRANSDRLASRDPQRKRLKSAESIKSYPTQEMLHLKQEIDDDLSQAHMLSTSLRNSLENDLQRSINENTCNWVFDSMKSRQDIAGSVARCYDLEDNSDTYSYVSSYFPCRVPRRKLEYNIKPNPDHVSSESVQSYLPNDKMYPPSNGSSDSQSGKSYSESKDGDNLSKGYNSVKSPRKKQFTKYLVSETTGIKSYYL